MIKECLNFLNLRQAFLLVFACFVCNFAEAQQNAWIRINQLGYTPAGKKVAVWGGKSIRQLRSFEVKNAKTGKTVYVHPVGKDYGAYGPFVQSFRLDFSSMQDTGHFFIQAGEIKSPNFRVGLDVYKGAADFVLRYMRQQRTLFNPFLKDSCHTHDGFTLYAGKVGIADSSRMDAGGGWHDASDYLQ